MKKQLLIAATLLTGGLAVPASAQYHNNHCNTRTEVYISGYLPCGAPIYARRIVSSRPHHHLDYYREQLRIQREREYRRQLEIQRRLAYQRELERRRYYQSQRSRHYYQAPRCR
ncbi:MAG: hypothetical protein ACON38_03115 [Akkermansiaceae bacterium]